ncbi:OmpA family protein [Vibrio sp. J1-1]|uniref:OmpA family protein n=1 Tax=Vibrio sp. J1-1 TaxID=2912251 RepID=UPI001F39CD0F|nr:OmpA family protein [Vibrio sp. J1-1]MCF7480995.1 OmpA family protein [Vibrio sp. J1-1]
MATTSALLACTTKGDLLVGEQTATSYQIGNDLTSEVVFYNAGLKDEQSKAMVIFSNGSVMAGLQPSQYAVLPVCKGNQSFQVTRGGVGGAVNVNISAQSLQYVKLFPYSTPSGIRYEQSSVTSINDALKESRSRSKSFLVPRHQLNCETSEPVEFNLSSESFFEFGGAQLMDVVQSDTLQKVIDFIDTHEDKGLKITVSGYTDHIGTKDFNQKLSEERAQTVADYIISRGYGGPIHAFGFGPSEPVVTCSSTLAREELIRCLQPNRRVTVRIWQSG